MQPQGFSLVLWWTKQASRKAPFRRGTSQAPGAAFTGGAGPEQGSPGQILDFSEFCFSKVDASRLL